MPSVWRRVLFGILLAAGLIVVLQIAVQAGSGTDAEPVAEPPRDTPRLPAELRRRTLLLYLVSEPDRMPERVAPVVEVLVDGGLEVRRPSAVPDGPEDGPWLAAGVILPGSRLQDLTPVQRAALLSVCEGFSGGDRLDPEAVLGLGFDFGQAELRRLLHWVR